jgi:hypothetical protein
MPPRDVLQGGVFFQVSGSVREEFGEDDVVCPIGDLAEQDEADRRDLGVGLEVVARGREGDAGRLSERISVGSGADRGEGDALDGSLAGQT